MNPPGPERKPEAPGDPEAVVVALGASAGGLDALEQFFAQVPANPGVAFVVVQHLEPRHPSLLVELLSKRVRMPVLEVADGLRAEADRVYVVAPGTTLAYEHGVFRVTASVEPPRAAIDIFFRSLAEARGDGVVGIVLSGAGHDGTVGLRAIKERGGLTIAQAPETARSDSMPQGAIEAGVVDHVLPPGQMASVVLEHARYVAGAARHGGATAALDAELPGRVRDVCELVRQRTGHDFTSYKEGTLLRRIRRRLQVLHVGAVGDYLDLLEKDATEAEALVRELLIGVTQFFRDPEAFQALAQQVMPRILQSRPSDVAVRIWVPGCASGEEVYSIAILVREHVERLGARRAVQIFATDLDDEMLAEARRGRYPLAIAEHVAAERLARFFTREQQSYEAAKELREMCIFSQHSLIRDPPFSQLDLVSCRNVLIYLSADLQKKLVPLFHYALRPGGFLFLGPSESIAQSPELFEPLDKRHRIFRRKEPVTRPRVEFPLAARGPSRVPVAPQTPGAAQHPMSSPRERLEATFQRLVLEEYSHPCWVVQEGGDIVLVAGPVGRFLQVPAGAPTSNLLDAVRGSLRLELRAALHSASRTGRRVVRDHVPVEIDDAVHRVRLVVRPVPGTDPGSTLFLVALQERAPSDEKAGEDVRAASAHDAAAVEQLEDELRSTRAELNTTVEQLEGTNEELKSSNEELISTNEELQSANEELQTSKEELQSLNEELETVNAELRHKVEELATANSDLQNLFASTDVATIFLDPDSRIVKFTPAAAALCHLLPTDIGRPIADLAARFVGQDLAAASRAVLTTLTAVERQVRAADGDSWFILRVVPYRTAENLVAGVVVTFVDVSPLKRAEEALRESEGRLRRAQEMAHLGSWELDLETNHLFWSDEVYRIFGLPAQAFGATYEAFLEAVHPDDRAAVDAAYSGSLREGRDRYEIVHRVVRRSGEIRIVQERCEHLRDARGRIVKSLGMVHDVTELRQMEEGLRRSEALHRAIARNLPGGAVLVFDSQHRILVAEGPLLGAVGLPLGRIEGRPAREVFGGAAEGAEIPELIRRTLAGESTSREVEQSGLTIWSHHVPIRDESGAVVAAMLLALDITDLKRAEQALRASEERLELAFKAAKSGSFDWHLKKRANLWSDELLSLYGLQQSQFGGRYEDWIAAVVPEDREAAAAAVERSLQTGLFECEFRIRRRDSGEVRWLYARGEVLFDEARQPERMVGTHVDVTDRRQAEEEVKRSREGLRLLADASLHVMRRTELAGMLQAISEAALALTGARLSTCGHGLVGGEPVVGGSARAPGAPACPPGEMFVLEKGGVHMELVDGADAIRLTDAEMRAHPRWWGLPEAHVPMRGLLGVPMLGRNGRTNGMILVTDKAQGDFTAEDESLLRQLATVASLALQHVEARISLEEADRRKDQFLAMLSHELRNPLAPIRNSLFVLERATPGGEQARRAQTVIERQVGHMTRLVDDLLDVTRISRGKIQLRWESLDLADLVRRAVEDHRSAFEANELDLQVALSDRPVPIDGDRTRIAQVIGNLLQNAAKFTPAGGRIAVSLDANEALGEAIVTVRDTGVGIAAEMLPRIFEPFMQADATLDRAKGGLGLGLTLVKGLAEMHGGSVSVRSAGLGRGTEFAVRLPLRAGVAPETERAGAVAQGVAGRRVLVIEDNPDAAESLRDVLELEGHVIEVAHSGTAGIEKARSFGPDVVLCDIGLPDMNGYDVARAMRADPMLGSVSLVALTGYAGPDDIARSRAAGFDQHLAKPLSMERLASVIAAAGREAPAR